MSPEPEVKDTSTDVGVLKDPAKDDSKAKESVETEQESTASTVEGQEDAREPIAKAVSLPEEGERGSVKKDDEEAQKTDENEASLGKDLGDKIEALHIDGPSSMKTEGTSSPTAAQPTLADHATITAPPPPPPKDDKYVGKGKGLGLGLDTNFDEEKEAMKADDNKTSEEAVKPTGDGAADDQESEIASIMEQFDDGKEGPGEQEIMSPRLEIAQPMFGFEGHTQHPPRKSSLEPIRTGSPDSHEGSIRKSSSQLMSPPPRTSSLALGGSPAASIKGQTSIPNEPESPAPLTPSISKSLPPPPQPDVEPELPFDFQRFLEQLRHKSADPVAKYLRSFLMEFGKKPWMVHEQVKIISDFLEFITKKMASCEVWRTVSDAEFDNAREGMEKLVMNRLYTQTFSPAIPAPDVKSRRRHGEGSNRSGRRGQHQEDVERDEVLAQKVRIYGWVREEHLDISPIGDKGKKFMDLAQKEILKIKSYRAPRDKVICILNCCKVIFGFLRNAPTGDQSADSFIPLMIYVVLRANPDHLVSNVQYILRFRNQDKLGGEAGYYISSLMGAIQFIEGLDRTSLTITDEEFEKNVEAAVSAIAEKHTEEEQPPPLPSNKPPPSPGLMPKEKSELARPEITPRNSLDAETAATPRRSTSSRRANATGSKSDNEKQAPEEEENAALAVLRTIQRPLSTIGRIFSDDGGQAASNTGPAATPSRSPAPVSAEEAASRQANAEARQAREISLREEKNLVETLGGMFPALEKEVLVDVVRANEGRVGKAVDACLALSAS